jgi:hypothetical protein
MNKNYRFTIYVVGGMLISTLLSYSTALQQILYVFMGGLVGFAYYDVEQTMHPAILRGCISFVLILSMGSSANYVAEGEFIHSAQANISRINEKQKVRIVLHLPQPIIEKSEGMVKKTIEHGPSKEEVRTSKLAIEEWNILQAEKYAENKKEKRRALQVKNQFLKIKKLKSDSIKKIGHGFFQAKKGVLHYAAQSSKWCDKREKKYEKSIVHDANFFNINPNLLRALACQESRWQQSALSPMGAIGIMQIMPDTGKHLGVNPKNTRENIFGGAKYIREMYDTFGSLEYAIAAYNCGPGRFMSSYKRVKNKTMKNILHDLPDETRDYVKNVMRYLTHYNHIYIRHIQVAQN